VGVTSTCMPRASAPRIMSSYGFQNAGSYEAGSSSFSPFGGLVAVLSGESPRQPISVWTVSTPSAAIWSSARAWATGPSL
jgi:hypothetical protein